MELDQNGDLCNAFKSFFNSKNYGIASIQPHQLMEDKGIGNAVFGKGVLMTLWSGNFSRLNPLAPGALSLFSFKEIEPLSSSQHERLLLLSMVPNAKGDLLKSLDEIEVSSKVDTMVPTDYYGFKYQMKAYSAMIGIITGKNSFVSVQLENLVR